MTNEQLAAFIEHVARRVQAAQLTCKEDSHERHQLACLLGDLRSQHTLLMGLQVSPDVADWGSEA